MTLRRDGQEDASGNSSVTTQGEGFGTRLFYRCCIIFVYFCYLNLTVMLPVRYFILNMTLRGLTEPSDPEGTINLLTGGEKASERVLYVFVLRTGTPSVPWKPGTPIGPCVSR